MLLGLIPLFAYIGYLTEKLNQQHMILEESEKKYRRLYSTVIEDIAERGTYDEFNNKEASYIKELIKELKSTRNYLENIITRAPGAIVTLDSDFNIVTWNMGAEEIFGYKTEETQGRTVMELISKTYQEKARKYMETAFSGKDVKNYEGLFITKNGKEKYCLVSGGPIIEDGKVEGITAIFKDITELKKTQRMLKSSVKKLKEANRMKELYNDILRHDLLNFIGIILNYAEILQEEEMAPKKELGIIEKNARKANNLIDLATTLINVASQRKLEYEELELNELLEKITADFRQNHPERDISLNAPKNKVRINSSKLIEQVFVNLISNALKYSPSETPVKVELEEDGEDVVVKVIDYGEGVPDKSKELIFERFTRRSKGPVKGTGIGLAIVKKVVELHRGRVWVEDNPEGGSVFVVELPKEP